MTDPLETMALGLFHRVGAIITNSHFVYTSGRHGSAYVNKDALYPDTRITKQLCFHIAAWIRREDVIVDTVIGPAMGGIILSQLTAQRLSELNNVKVLSVYAEKDSGDGSFAIRRGYPKHITGKNVLVVEDILNTGGSAKKVVEAVHRHGGNVVAVTALCNRGGVTGEDVGNPPRLFALANIKMDTWDAADCPLCQQDVPINTEVGKGREFLANQK